MGTVHKDLEVAADVKEEHGLQIEGKKKRCPPNKLEEEEILARFFLCRLFPSLVIHAVLEYTIFHSELPQVKR